MIGEDVFFDGIDFLDDWEFLGLDDLIEPGIGDDWLMMYGGILGVYFVISIIARGYFWILLWWIGIGYWMDWIWEFMDISWMDFDFDGDFFLDPILGFFFFGFLREFILLIWYRDRNWMISISGLYWFWYVIFFWFWFWSIGCETAATGIFFLFLFWFWDIRDYDDLIDVGFLWFLSFWLILLDDFIFGRYGRRKGFFYGDLIGWFYLMIFL